MTLEGIRHAVRRKACNWLKRNGPALATCHRGGKGVGLFQLFSALKPGHRCLRLLFFWLSRGLVQGSSSADTAASWLRTDTDLGEQRKSGRVCFQPKHMERLAVQRPGCFCLSSSKLCSQTSSWYTLGSSVYSTLAPNHETAQYKCPQKGRPLS